MNLELSFTYINSVDCRLSTGCSNWDLSTHLNDGRPVRHLQNHRRGNKLSFTDSSRLYRETLIYVTVKRRLHFSLHAFRIHSYSSSSLSLYADEKDFLSPKSSALWSHYHETQFVIKTHMLSGPVLGPKFPCLSLNALWWCVHNL